MRRLHIVHRTYYNFTSVVTLGPHRLLLRPREGHALQIESSTLEIAPTASLHWSRDEYDNSIATATFDAPAQQLSILSDIVVRHHDEAPFDFVVEQRAENYPFTFEPESAAVLQPYLSMGGTAGDVEALRVWLSGYWQPGQRVQTYALLWRLCSAIPATFKYQSREAQGIQSVADTLSRRSGSCRDFAHLFIESARYLGLAARFVSGYLNVPASNSDCGATHAWAEIYLPGPGWKGFDPTIGEVASAKHIAVAVGRAGESLPPIAGSYFGTTGSTMSVGVWVNDLGGR
jgi:transglutaminase-like putative cysteine protease